MQNLESYEALAVQEMLENRMSLDQFQDWSAAYSWDIHKHAGQEVQNLAYMIEGLLVEFSNGDIDETAFRTELAKSTRHYLPIEIVFGEAWDY